MKKLTKISGSLILLTLMAAQLFAGVTARASGVPSDEPSGVLSGEPSGVSAPRKERTEVPIIMYHLITKNERYMGKYGITPKEMENDLIYLKDNGYETVLMRDLISYVDGNGDLPEKPIVLTFDDGNSSDYNYLFPLLKKYGMKAVCSIVGKFTDEYDKDTSSVKPYLDWGQIKEMQELGIIEIQNHSYNMHGGNGSGKLTSESAEAYRARLSSDLETTQKKIQDATGYTPTTFTYPLGVIGKGSLEVLKDLKFQASLSCWEGINIVTRGEPDCLFVMRRAIRKGGQPVSDVLSGAYLRLKKERANSEKS